MLHTQEKGRSMIEMLGVLAIIGVLSVGGLAGYNMAMGRVRVNRVIDDLQLVAVNIRTAVPNGVYDNIGTIAGNMDILDELNANLGSLGASASAAVVEQNSGNSSTVNDRFAIVFTNLPLDACRRIAGLDWGVGAYVAASAATANSTVTTTTPTGTSAAIATCASTDPIASWSLMLK